jgi:hypothetical protein
MKLSKWGLFLARWLNFWDEFYRIVTSKKFILVFSIVLIVISFGFGFILKYKVIETEISFKHYLKVSQENVTKEQISSTVKYIMKLNRCDSLVIYESIMKTFDPILIAFLIAVESEYKVNAISPAGALGLTQIMPDKLRKGDNWQDPETNIRIGSNYLKGLLEQFNDYEDKEILALSAYNAGPNAVIKNNFQVPITKNNETKLYISKINKLKNIISNLR